MPKLSMADMEQSEGLKKGSGGQRVAVNLNHKLSKKERQQRSWEAEELRRQNADKARREKAEEEEEMVRLEAATALDAASDIANWPLSHRERRFLIEYAVQLHRAKTR